MAKGQKLPRIDAPVEELAAELLRRRRSRVHILPFTEYTHPRWETSVHHEIICDHLERLESGEITRLMIHAPPRHSKSELASRRFPAWWLGRNPHHQIILTAYGDTLAEDLSRDVRDIVRDEYYRPIFGETCQVDPETKAGSRWQTTGGGIVVAAGVGGAITGRGADLAIIDDPHKDREEADSLRVREKIWAWYHGVLRTRLMPGGKILLMMTRWHEDDLAGRLQESEPGKWTILNLEAVSGEGTKDEKALWESKYSLRYLQDFREDLASAGRLREWKSQYQQTPTADEGIEFKREWFSERYTDLPKELALYSASDLAVTSQKVARDPDWTEHAVAGLAADGRLYVLDWWSGRVTPDEWMEALIKMMALWKPRKWTSEGGKIRRACEGELVRRCNESRTYFHMEWRPTHTDKAARATAFKAWASMRRIVFPKTRWAEEVIDNVVGFPTLRHDDKFDTMATLVASLDDAARPVITRTRERRRDPWQKTTSTATGLWKTV